MKNKVSASLLMIVMAVFALSTVSFAHAKLKPGGKLKLREDNAGIKTGPCGSAPRSANPTLLKGGEKITVEWMETINHPGYFRIAFSQSGDKNFEQNVLATVEDNKNLTTDLPHSFSKVITVPNVACEACTIQLIQYMTENPANVSLYYSCADIKIEANSDEPSGVPTPANEVTPASSDQNCK